MFVNDENNTPCHVFKDVERIDSILRDIGVYKKEKRDYSLYSSRLKCHHKSNSKLAKG